MLEPRGWVAQWKLEPQERPSHCCGHPMRQRGKERNAPDSLFLLPMFYQCLPWGAWETAYKGPLVPLPSLSRYSMEH